MTSWAEVAHAQHDIRKYTHTYTSLTFFTLRTRFLLANREYNIHAYNTSQRTSEALALIERMLITNVSGSESRCFEPNEGETCTWATFQGRVAAAGESQSQLQLSLDYINFVIERDAVAKSSSNDCLTKNLTLFWTQYGIRRTLVQTQRFFITEDKRNNTCLLQFRWPGKKYRSQVYFKRFYTLRLSLTLIVISSCDLDYPRNGVRMTYKTLQQKIIV